jgi:hypothetical protein
MLHELLVALSGVSGSIFVDKKEQGFKVNRRYEFLKNNLQNYLCSLESNNFKTDVCYNFYNTK